MDHRGTNLWNNERGKLKPSAELWLSFPRMFKGIISKSEWRRITVVCRV